LNFSSIKAVFTNNPLAKNIFIVLSGNVGGHLITAVSYLVLSHIYAVEDFGLFSLFLSIVLPISVISTGKYEMATITSHTVKNIRPTIFNAAILATSFSFIAFLFLFLFKNLIADKFHTTLLTKIWLFIPLIILVQGLNQSFSAFLQRHEKYNNIASIKVTQTFFIALVSVSLGLVSVGTGLVLGYLAGWTMMLFATIYYVNKLGFFTEWPSLKNIKESFKEYSEFPLYSTLPALLNFMIATVQTGLILTFFTNIENGHYGFARQVLIMPLSVISTSFSQVFFVNTAQLVNQQKPIFVELRRYFIMAITFALCICIPFIFFGQSLFLLFFGQKWVISGEISSILGISTCLQMSILPFSSIMISIKKVKAFSLWQVLAFTAYALLYFVHFSNFKQLIFSFMSIELVSMLCLGGLMTYHILIYEKTAKEFSSDINQNLLLK
jgi:O-antigen/teichoic acid export membrane protein